MVKAVEAHKVKGLVGEYLDGKLSKESLLEKVGKEEVKGFSLMWFLYFVVWLLAFLSIFIPSIRYLFDGHYFAIFSILASIAYGILSIIFLGIQFYEE